MPAVPNNERWRWGAAAAGGLVIVAAVLTLFRLPSAPISIFAPSSVTSEGPKAASSAPREAAAVHLAKPDAAQAVLSEEMALRDMRPLFLPTEWNAALPEPRLEPGRTFLDDETVKLSFPAADLPLAKALPPIATINGKRPEDARALDGVVSDPYGLSLDGFGRSPISVKPADARGGFIEIVSSATGQTILTEPLPVAARPPTEKAWVPMELLAVIDAAGLLSPLVVTESSRVEEVDVHFRNFLAQRFRIGERLAPGFYRIVVGP